MTNNPSSLRSSLARTKKAELEALGLGDPRLSLHQSALQDFYLVSVLSVLGYIVALVLDLGDLFLAFTASHESWEIDEIFMAALFSLVGLCWLSWRQWRRYDEEISRRIALEEDIVEMRMMADSLSQNKTAFLANLGHDLRTPLNGVLGFAQLLEEEPFGPIANERYKNYIKSIRESAAMLDERLTTCLDPDKVEFGAEPLQMKPWPVKDLIASALPIVAPVAESGGIRIELDVEADLPNVHADQRAIKKILVNLISNAIKFNRPKGAIRISAKLTDGKALELIVQDNGIGIAIDDLDPRWSHPQMIKPQAGAQPRHGMGVGLSVVQDLIDMHGASLVVRSIPKRGTTVILTFPPDRLVVSAPQQSPLVRYAE